MVRAAKVKQVGAEKRFKEANNKVCGSIDPLYKWRLNLNNNTFHMNVKVKT